MATFILHVLGDDPSQHLIFSVSHCVSTTVSVWCWGIKNNILMKQDETRLYSVSVLVIKVLTISLASLMI